MMEFCSDIRRKQQQEQARKQASQTFQRRISAARALNFDGTTRGRQPEQPSVLRAKNFYRSSESRLIGEGRKFYC